MGIVRKDLYCELNNDVACMFHHLSHPGRVKILILLLTSESRTLGELQQDLGLSQASTSDQVRVLKDAGLIHGEAVGTSMRYSIHRENWEKIKRLNGAFWQVVGEL